MDSISRKETIQISDFLLRCQALGRNDLCACNSKLKYKNCCEQFIEEYLRKQESLKVKVSLEYSNVYISCNDIESQLINNLKNFNKYFALNIVSWISWQLNFYKDDFGFIFYFLQKKIKDVFVKDKATRKSLNRLLGEGRIIFFPRSLTSLGLFIVLHSEDLNTVFRNEYTIADFFQLFLLSNELISKDDGVLDLDDVSSRTRFCLQITLTRLMLLLCVL